MSTKNEDPTQQVAFRLPASLLERLDDEVGVMTKERPGVKVTRADAVRVLLLEALDRRQPKRRAG